MAGREAAFLSTYPRLEHRCLERDRQMRLSFQFLDQDRSASHSSVVSQSRVVCVVECRLLAKSAPIVSRRVQYWTPETILSYSTGTFTEFARRTCSSRTNLVGLQVPADAQLCRPQADAWRDLRYGYIRPPPQRTAESAGSALGVRSGIWIMHSISEIAVRYCGVGGDLRMAPGIS